jgi:hypothetical protein
MDNPRKYPSTTLNAGVKNTARLVFELVEPKSSLKPKHNLTLHINFH